MGPARDSQRRGMSILIGFEYIQALQLLIEDCKRLKSFGLFHLNPEPVLHLVLPIIFEIPMYVIEVPGSALITANEMSVVMNTYSVVIMSPRAVSNRQNSASLQYHTISSLQIGQASCAPVAAGAADIEVLPFSKDILEVRSCVSSDGWDVDVCELSDRLLVDGDRTFCCGDGVEGRFFAEPKTRPPPRVLRDMIAIMGEA